MPVRAALAQGKELFFQGLHALHACLDAGQLGIDQGVDVGAGGSWRIHEFKQALDVGEGNIKCPAVADEGQAFEVCRGVRPVTVALPGRRRKQAGFLVVADGFDIDAGGAGKFADTQWGGHGRGLERKGCLS